MNFLTPETIAALQSLASLAGAAAGRASAETILEAEAQAAQAMPLSPVEQAAQDILAGLEAWAREASGQPRSKDSQQALMLQRAKRFLEARAESQAAGDSAT